MADNVSITPGVGDTVAADDIGGAKYQRVKLGIGADGESADLDHGQAAMAASLPVVEASDTPFAVAIGTTTDAAASSSVAEDATARTGISLWKGIKNILILINAKLAALGQAAMAGSMPVAIASNQSAVAVTPGAQEVHLGEVGGNTPTIQASFTRPADTTAYTAKDAVSNSTGAPTVITFSNMARVSGGNGYITKMRLMTNQSTNVAQFRLHLYHTAPTPIADNALYTLLWANRANRIGWIDVDALQTEAAGSDCANQVNTSIRLQFTTSGSRHLYGMLETLSAFTPASEQVFFIELGVESN